MIFLLLFLGATGAPAETAVTVSVTLDSFAEWVPVRRPKQIVLVGTGGFTAPAARAGGHGSVAVEGAGAFLGASATTMSRGAISVVGRGVARAGRPTAALTGSVYDPYLAARLEDEAWVLGDVLELAAPV